MFDRNLIIEDRTCKAKGRFWIFLAHVTLRIVTLLVNILDFYDHMLFARHMKIGFHFSVNMMLQSAGLCSWVMQATADSISPHKGMWMISQCGLEEHHWESRMGTHRSIGKDTNCMWTSWEAHCDDTVPVLASTRCLGCQQTRLMELGIRLTSFSLDSTAVAWLNALWASI